MPTDLPIVPDRWLPRAVLALGFWSSALTAQVPPKLLLDLYRTLGTPGSTVLAADLVPGMNSSSPRALIAAGSQLFFLVDHPQYGVELWATDGQSTPTMLPLSPTFRVCRQQSRAMPSDALTRCP